MSLFCFEFAILERKENGRYKICFGTLTRLSGGLIPITEVQFFVVMQNEAFVLDATSAYFLELKKVISVFGAVNKSLISKTSSLS